MQKLPTLFEKTNYKRKNSLVLPNVLPGLEWVLAGEGTATIKWDGSCCAIIHGDLYKRFVAKTDEPIPAGSIPCQSKADPVTGFLPCWVKCTAAPLDKWFWEAYDSYRVNKTDGTYEAIGAHFRDNPYRLKNDLLIPHGQDIIEVERSYEGIKKYLQQNTIEGIVFWKDGEPKCKIKRRDFGIPWGRELNKT